MKVLQINALYGNKSTGTIMRQIQNCCWVNGIDGYVAFSYADRPLDNIRNAYQIGNKLTVKLHALLSRIGGKQAYFSRFTTYLFLRYLNRIKPDIVHLHNLHNNYINLNMLLHYLAKHNIITVITMHDCWYFTGGCTHYANVGCSKWLTDCGKCPLPKSESKAYIYDASQRILQDRVKYLNAITHLVMVGCSEWIANECRNSILKNKDVRCIHNGFDLTIFRPVDSVWRERLGIEGKFVILAPAIKWHLTVNKTTFDYFVENMSDDMVMVLFGCSHIKEYSSDKIKQVGYLTSPTEMASLYSMADVMVNCSREDTLSSLNIESQACGTPVVTYDATGSAETVDGLCGFAVETGNYRLLYEKVIEIKKVGESELSDKCISWVKNNFELNASFQHYVDLYKELSNNVHNEKD